MRLQLLFLALILCSGIGAQEWMSTQAQITTLETRISGRKLIATAQVKYAVPSGDSLLGQVSLIGLPFLGLSKGVGDVIPVVYQKDHPYFIKTKEESILQTYGLYMLIGLGIIITGHKLTKRRKTPAKSSIQFKPPLSKRQKSTSKFD